MRNVTTGLEDRIVELYCEQGLTLKKIAIKFNISTTPVTNCLKKLGIARRDYSESRRIYDLNRGYFHNIGTPDKAQIVGFIYADGCIMEKSYRLSIGLHKKDRDYLEFIKSRLEYDGPIYDKQKSVALTINCDEIYNDLIDIGLTQRKSLTLNFPSIDKIPELLYPHFIRGYLEGDGCICTRGFFRKNNEVKILSGMVTICGTFQFLLSIQNVLSKLDIKSAISQKRILKERGVNSHVLTITNAQRVVKFLDWIYEGYQTQFNFVMTRKYNKYLELKESLYERDLKKV